MGNFYWKIGLKMPKIRKRTSKRLGFREKYSVLKKVNEHQKKMKEGKEARLSWCKASIEEEGHVDSKFIPR